jgi:P27 family predicted phage terminase small subunit
MPEKPAGLSPEAARNWDRLVDEMQKSGITLIPAFRSAIVQAATIQADLETAWEDIRENGRYIVSKTGVKKINPAVEDTHKLNEKLSRALYALGLTPKSLGGNEVTEPPRTGRKLDLKFYLSGEMTPEQEAEYHAHLGE